MGLKSLPTFLSFFLSIIKLGGSIEFFISQIGDLCSRGSHQIGCYKNSESGGLCAFAPAEDKLWCCPASFHSCRSQNVACTGNSFYTPGPGQILCYSEGWCCDQLFEACPAHDEKNLCVTTFKSQNYNVPIDVANAAEHSARSAFSPANATTAGGSTSISSLLSTATEDNTATSSTTTSSIKTPTPSSSQPSAENSIHSTPQLPADKPTPSPSPPSADEPTPSPSPQPTHSSRLSTGSIAGIVLGAIFSLGLLSLALLLLLLKRNRKAHKEPPLQAYAPAGNNVVEHGGTTLAGPMTELTGKTRSLELPVVERRHELL